jgi:hypothetical protein
MCLSLLAQTPTQQQSPPQSNAETNASAAASANGGRDQNNNWRKIKVKLVANPDGATAQCQDKTYSKSDHVSGTCVGHGGVKKWLRPVTLE